MWEEPVPSQGSPLIKQLCPLSLQFSRKNPEGEFEKQKKTGKCIRGRILRAKWYVGRDPEDFEKVSWGPFCQLVCPRFHGT